MNMKRLLTLVAFFATFQASAQQVNPVPDYVFANRMSAGRNTVTDTGAYFSIGPRYGATRGMMPPMVVDTASFSAYKRNGLLIFSVQKNKFLYWDSVGVKWAEMAGTAGTALTSADTAALLSTRAWRQKGIDSLAAIRIAGSGTTNYLPKFTATRTIGNSQIFDDGTSVGVGTASPISSYKLHVTGDLRVANSGTETGAIQISNESSEGLVQTRFPQPLILGANATKHVYIRPNGAVGFGNASPSYRVDVTGQLRATSDAFFSTASGETYIGTTSDAGDYKLQVSGNLYNTGGAVFAATSGNVGVKTASPQFNLDVFGTGRFIDSLRLGKLNTDSQTLLSMPADIRMLYFQRKDSLFGFKLANINGEYIFLQANENSGRQTLLFGDGDDTSNVFGISTSDDFGATYTAKIAMNQNGYFGLSTNKPTQILDVNGKARIRTIDSTSTGSNVLYSDADGVIKKSRGPSVIHTSDPSGGTSKPWKLGEAATVSPTSPNRTIRVEIDGTVYYIHAKTTND